ncbi:hypothetical protein [Micromonospora sp. CA-246542]|uniref:hypothetical protein n=1 Tax=Micromonospora sp. CA-246542 TaxID=3239959 RepID=UPI003D917B86
MPDRPSSARLTASPSGRRRDLLRTAQLNAAGWAAVAAICVIGAATGLAATRLTGTPSWLTTPAGAAAAFAAVLAADRRKWANMPTTYSWTDNPTEVQRIASALQHAGIDATADTADTADLEQPTLRYLNRDYRRVARAFRAAGLPPPPRN